MNYLYSVNGDFIYYKDLKIENFTSTAEEIKIGEIIQQSFNQSDVTNASLQKILIIKQNA